MNTNGIVGESPANTALDLFDEIIIFAIEKDNTGYISEAENDYGMKIADAFRILKKAIDRAEKV